MTAGATLQRWLNDKGCSKLQHKKPVVARQFRGVRKADTGKRLGVALALVSRACLQQRKAGDQAVHGLLQLG